jgi:hypothetical protein
MPPPTDAVVALPSYLLEYTERVHLDAKQSIPVYEMTAYRTYHTKNLADGMVVVDEENKQRIRFEFRSEKDAIKHTPFVWRYAVWIEAVFGVPTSVTVTSYIDISKTLPTQVHVLTVTSDMSRCFDMSQRRPVLGSK